MSSEFQSQPSVEGGRRRPSITGKVPITEHDAFSEMSQKADHEENLRREKIAEARKLRREKIDEEMKDFSDEESNSSNTDSRTGTPQLNVQSNRRHKSPSPPGKNKSPSPTRINTSPSPIRNKSPLPSRRVRSPSPTRHNKSPSPTHRNKSPTRFGLETSSKYYMSNGPDRESRESLYSLQSKYRDLDNKYKDAMVSNAQLYNEKNTLYYTVDSLKDKLEDIYELHQELKANFKQEASNVHKLKHQLESCQEEISSLKAMVKFRDDFLESRGVNLAELEEGEEGPKLITRGMDSAEKEELLEQIKKLKNEVAQLKSSSSGTGEALANQDHKDIVRESTKLVIEYKSKLQQAEGERQRLEGTVQRQENQIKRMKGQVENLEKQEDELIEEKRKQNREIRKLQQEIDELKTDNELLQKRVDGLRRRQQT